MNGVGECWPSKQQLADDTGYTKRTVDAAVVRLELVGLLTVNRGGGRGFPNRYTATNRAMVAPIPKLKGAIHDTKGCNSRHVKGATIAPEVEKKKKEVRRAPLTATAAAPAITVDEAMLAMAHGWLEVHQ
jgi:DNA-binding transcriptional MocR family regulator